VPQWQPCERAGRADRTQTERSAGRQSRCAAGDSPAHAHTPHQPPAKRLSRTARAAEYSGTGVLTVRKTRTKQRLFYISWKQKDARFSKSAVCSNQLHHALLNASKPPTSNWFHQQYFHMK